MRSHTQEYARERLRDGALWCVQTCMSLRERERELLRRICDVCMHVKKMRERMHAWHIYLIREGVKVRGNFLFWPWRFKRGQNKVSMSHNLLQYTCSLNAVLFRDNYPRKSLAWISRKAKTLIVIKYAHNLHLNCAFSQYARISIYYT